MNWPVEKRDNKERAVSASVQGPSRKWKQLLAGNTCTKPQTLLLTTKSKESALPVRAEKEVWMGEGEPAGGRRKDKSKQARKICGRWKDGGSLLKRGCLPAPRATRLDSLPVDLLIFKEHIMHHLNCSVRGASSGNLVFLP